MGTTARNRGNPREAIFSFLKLGHEDTTRTIPLWLSADLDRAVTGIYPSKHDININQDQEQDRFMRGDLYSNGRKVIYPTGPEATETFEHRSSDNSSLDPYSLLGNKHTKVHREASTHQDMLINSFNEQNRADKLPRVSFGARMEHLWKDPDSRDMVNISLDNQTVVPCLVNNLSTVRNLLMLSFSNDISTDRSSLSNENDLSASLSTIISDGSLDIPHLTANSSTDHNILLSHTINRGGSYNPKNPISQFARPKYSVNCTWEYVLASEHDCDLSSSVQANQNLPNNICLMGISCPQAKFTARRLPVTFFQDDTPQINRYQKMETSQVEMHKIYVRKRKQARRANILKQLLSGAFAGVISRTAVAPLDLIKTFQITSHGLGGAERSAATICKEIVKQDGWQGLFRGNLVNCIRVAPSKAVELYVFETVRRALNKKGHPLKNAAAVIAGGAAGMAGTMTTYPLELIRTRISVQPELYSGLLQAMKKIASDEGLMAFYSGLTPSLVGVFPYAATNYFVYDALRTRYCQLTKRKNVPTLPTLLFGAVSACASSAVTYPLEVARRQMQLCLKDGILKRSTLNVLLDISQREGFWALYRGLGTTWLKLIPAAGISFVCYETARLALHIDDASTMKIEETSLDLEEQIQP